MESIENYRTVYQMLEDAESRFIWINRLNYLISGDMRFVQGIVDKCLPQLSTQIERVVRDTLSRMPAEKNFVLFGAGQQGAEILPYVKKDKRFQGFCSSTKKKQESGYCGYPVISPEELLANRDLSVIISVAIPHVGEEILQILRDGNYPEHLIFTLVKEFNVDSGQYFAPNFIKYEDEEIFVDAGSYDLETAISLKNYCKKVKKVYAFEPDAQSYKKCLYNKDAYHFAEAEILPFGTWSEKKTLQFQAEKSICSCVSDWGENVIRVTTIDETVDKNDRVTFIKMDVEGSELESLKGAKHIICRDKPKLAICIYHKPEDMTEIPLYIKSLVPEYKIYVRYHSNSDAETVLYAVIPEQV